MSRFLAVTLAIVLTFPLAAHQNTGDPRPSAEVSIEAIDLVDVGSNHVRFNLETHVVASRSIKVRRICFEAMRIGGVPVYLGEVQGPLNLKDGVPAPLPAIPLTIYFRDLDSLVPILQAVRDGQFSVDGSARVEFDLNVFQKLALHSRSGRTEVAIHQDVPVSVAGGDIGRFAVVSALRAADLALSLGTSALESLRPTGRLR